MMSGKPFDWEKFQKHNKYSDEEMAVFRGDPRRANAAPKLFSRDIANKNLIIEVVKSHGCSAGLKPGDKLVFKALGVFDPKQSSRWCAQAMGSIPGVANLIQDRYVEGLDLNGSCYNHFSCEDVGPECGWGQVVMKYYVDEESEASK